MWRHRADTLLLDLGERVVKTREGVPELAVEAQPIFSGRWTDPDRRGVVMQVTAEVVLQPVADRIESVEPPLNGLDQSVQLSPPVTPRGGDPRPDLMRPLRRDLITESVFKEWVN